MSTNNHGHEIYDLIFASLSGIASEQQQKQLAQALEEDIDLQKEYVDFLITYTLLHRRSGASVFIEDVKEPVLDQKLWESLAYEEKTAPVIEMPREERLQQDLIQKVEYPAREKRKISRFEIFMLFNAAAVVLFLVILRIFPPTEGVEVATLSDSINAEWINAGGSMEIGTRLATRSEELYLRRGLAELLFDNNAEVVIEGPAEFELLGEDRIRLNYGKVYSIVPKEAIGFSVFTKNSKIFDMGTEFGVETDFRGNTLLHVMNGSTMLIAGGDQSGKKGITVDKGAAKKISAMNSEISDISCDYTSFVRNIDSRGDMIWRGGDLSLASIVAGYDGFQEVGSLTGLNPDNGERVASVSQQWRRSDKKAYSLVANSKYIDGVFVPNGKSGPIQITSLGHTFECPDTSGIFTHEIAAYKGSLKNQQTTIPPVIINGQEVADEPILMLHSNVGITFDLQAIHQSLPQLNITSLKTIGMPMSGAKYPDLDFWVLVDGQIKYERKIAINDNDRGPVPFDVELKPEDRFLTLIVTDGLQVLDDEGENISYAKDFFYLIEPELCLTNSVGR